MYRRTIDNIPENITPPSNSWILSTDPTQNNALQKTKLSEISTGGGLSNWLSVTSASQSSYLLEARKRFIIDSDINEFTATFPTNPLFGDELVLLCPGNQIKLDLQGEKLNQQAAGRAILTNAHGEVRFVYVNSTYGWLSSHQQSEFIPLATANLTNPTIWDDFTIDYPVNVEQEFSVKAIADVGPFLQYPEGVICEAGGSGSGFCIVVYNGVLFFQCGDGGTDRTEASHAYIEVSGLNGYGYEIEASASSITGKAALYVNRELIGTDTFSFGSAHGSNPGGMGRVRGEMCRNPSPYYSDNQGLYGTYEGYLSGPRPRDHVKVYYYPGQITEEVM